MFSTMSCDIKYIASFSEDAIDTALHYTVTGDEQAKFQATLKSIADKLEKPAKNRKTEKRKFLP